MIGNAPGVFIRARRWLVAYGDHELGMVFYTYTYEEKRHLLLPELMRPEVKDAGNEGGKAKSRGTCSEPSTYNRAEHEKKLRFSSSSSRAIARLDVRAPLCSLWPLGRTPTDHQHAPFVGRVRCMGPHHSQHPSRVKRGPLQLSGLCRAHPHTGTPPGQGPRI